jgi:tRNA/rRNA methyltransferase
MSETSPPPSSEGPVFILVRPQMGENIGAAARAMWNFGLDRMRLVAPRDGWPNPKAVATASGAGRVLDWAQVRESVADATADLTTVYASTARPREMTKLVMTPQAAAADMAARIAAGERVGIMMGPERTGLETDDIVRASVIVTVPTNPDFPSINLAQATLLMAWEWRRLQDDTAPAALRIPREGAPAPRAEIDGMLAHLEAELDDAHFFFPEHKRPKMLDNLRGLFFRAELTEADVRTLRGVIRALAEGRSGGGEGGSACPSASSVGSPRFGLARGRSAGAALTRPPAAPPDPLAPPSPRAPAAAGAPARRQSR